MDPAPLGSPAKGEPKDGWKLTRHRRALVGVVASLSLITLCIAVSTRNAESGATKLAPIADVKEVDCGPTPTNGPMAVASEATGYWLVASDGGIFTFGDAGFYGSTGGIKLNKPIVGMAPTPDGKGYWLVASDGGIFTFGDAGFYGSTGAFHLNKPIVGMSATPDGKGYWLVASDGGIFAFGDAGFYGSTGGIVLNKPIVGMAPTLDGKGYWLVASDGGIFTFGDAGYYGSTGDIKLNKPIVGMAPTPDGNGYWLVASDGGIFTFGDAGYHGSEPGAGVDIDNVVDIAASPSGDGYWMEGSDGRVSPFGDASSEGSMLGTPLNRPIVGFAAISATQTSTPQPVTTPPPTTPLASTSPLIIATSGLPDATVGVVYSTSLAASGGTAPYSWAITSGSLPTGLSISPTGVITGTPSTSGGFAFTVRVADATTPTAQTASTTLTITVAASIEYSENWSGYVAGNGPFTGVNGTFTVPTLYAGEPSGDRVTEWVGIDGGTSGDTSLIQAGVEEYPDPSDPDLFYIQPWWEILPAAQTNITSMTVGAGNEVTVTIGQISGTEWGITLTDDTNGESFTTDQTYTGPESTAEWIVEAPELNGEITTLAPYTPDVTFSDLGISPVNTTLAEFIMVQAASQVSTPSVLTSSGFNVAYGDTAPAPP
jgi:hypothetical protein